MLNRTILLALAGALALPMSTPALGGTQIPFTITSSATPGRYIACSGPWLRTSLCSELGSSANDKREFYRAEVTVFSPFGSWGCAVYPDRRCLLRPIAATEFCIAPGVPPRVDLTYNNSDRSLRVNANPTCPRALASSLLGQDGEDARTREDVDTYDFPGEAGEQVEVVLDVDGAAGALGGDATLRVLDDSRRELARNTGELPLSLEVTLTGPAAIEVRRGRSPDDYRGHYSLEVIPASDDAGEQRVLTPRPNVEG